jgi:class 3 adenylate cyclase/DNA-binding SARP family transcriptional activator
MVTLKLFLFGPPQVMLEEQPVDINRRKALAMLVYLAVSGQAHSRDALATLFYPDHDQSRARAYLRRDLAVLNSSLGGDWLETEQDRVELTPEAGFWLDVAQFQQLLARSRSHEHAPETVCADCLPLLTEAAKLYTDDFLAGFTLRDCPEFDDWQFFQAEGLRQELAAVLERLLEGLRGQGESEAAIPHARRWVALDPLHEPAQQALIQIYGQTGQQAAALRQYEEFAALLEAELGLPPAEETTTLYEAIKAQRLLRPFIKTQQESPGRAGSKIGPGDEPLKKEADTPEATGQGVGLTQTGDRKLPIASPSAPVFCPTCGAQVLAAQPFCGQCGTPLRRICSACGTENALDSHFCRQCGTPVTQPSPLEFEPAPEPVRVEPREERRWVTVLFANVSGFTAMSEQMDPEDVKLRADRWARRLSQEVRRFEGTVINIVGAEVVAVFGAPVAHEDDPERAVRAGLAMAGLNLADDPGETVRVHVVINTGQVIAGLMGPQERRDYTVMGDMVNTAAQLLPAAPSGNVLVGAATYRATQHVVNYRELSPIAVKGKGNPVPVWEALDVVALPQARPFGTVPLIGRDQELDWLLAMGNRVVDNQQPHLVTILGEAGIGKSRLVAEVEQHLPEAMTVLHGHCLPYGEALSYGALGTMLKEAAGITIDDEPETARAKLTDLVMGVIEPDGLEGDPRELTRHLALMSGLDLEADRLTTSLDERVFRVSARRFLTAFARHDPLCLVFNNLHWADTTLLDLIEYVAAHVQEVPLLIVTQSRPELLENRVTWGRGVQSFTSLMLQPLDAQAVQGLVLALCREHGLPDELATQISRSAGGNPLYAEELVAMVAEQGEEVGIPLAIKLLISARLDTLPPEERQMLQVAAVFGSVFWEGGLRALVVRDITGPLEALAQKGLLRAQPRSQYPGEREYAFKHDLIRDVAYEILPRTERRTFHGQAADWLEQTAGEHIEAYINLIAHHAVEAGQHERAITYLIRAADRAGYATAHCQEAALLDEAIAIAERLNQHAQTADLHVRRGRAFIDLGMWAEAQQELQLALAELGPEDIEQRVQVLADLAWIRFWLVDVSGQYQAANQAMALAETIDRDDLVAKAMFAVGFSHMNDAELRQTQNLCRGALTRAGDTAIMELAMAAWASGIVSFWHGEFEEAIEYQHKAVQMGHNGHHTIPTAIALPQLGLALAADGRYAEAEGVFDQSRQFGREYELWPFLARALAMAAGYHLDLCDYAGHEQIATEARELGLSLRFPPPTWSASIDLLLNFARRQEVARYDKLVDEVAEFVERAPGFHGWLWRLRFAEAQAEVALACGDWDEALRWAERGIARSREFGRAKYHALSLESRARALTRLNRTHEAVADLQSAVDIGRSIGDPAIFLRVATSLLAAAGDDDLLAETQAAARRISAALSDEAIRRHFEAGEPMQVLAGLTG